MSTTEKWTRLVSSCFTTDNGGLIQLVSQLKQRWSRLDSACFSKKYELKFESAKPEIWSLIQLMQLMQSQIDSVDAVDAVFLDAQRIVLMQFLMHDA